MVLKTTEDQFLQDIKDIIKPIDPIANVVPVSARTNTKSTTIKTFNVGIISNTEKTEEVFDAMLDFAKKNRLAVEYFGWSLAMEDKTFKTAVHEISAKIHKKGC